jgi:hypothetical protein
MENQTAVEWQFEQLFNSFEKFNNEEYTFNEYLKKNLEIREQAKEMEKQHMELIYDGLLQNVGTCIKQSDLPTFEQYYNETFKQQGQ